MSYVKWPGASWHVVRTYTRTGAVLTRCGRFLPNPLRELSESLPLDGSSCETCLRFAARDVGREVAP